MQETGSSWLAPGQTQPDALPAVAAIPARTQGEGCLPVRGSVLDRLVSPVSITR